jgi:short-subunit dehydrogenase
MKRNYFENKVALITGSSQGIGKTLAIELLKRNCKVVLNARSLEKLKSTFNELKQISQNVTFVVADVSIFSEVKNLIDQSVSKFGTLDIVINNAGLSMGGEFSELDLASFKTVLEVNLLGSVYVTKYALPFLRDQKGSIIFISSLAGLRGLPMCSPYSMSKMALKALADTLKVEEIKSKVHIGLMYVGFTNNDSSKKTYNSKGDLVLLKNRKGIRMQTQHSVALAILDNIRRKKYISTLSIMGKLMYFLERFFPSILNLILIKASVRIKAMT